MSDKVADCIGKKRSHYLLKESMSIQQYNIGRYYMFHCVLLIRICKGIIYIS